MYTISALRYHRRKNKLTLKQVALDTNFSEEALKEWEMLRRSINLENAVIFSNYFNEPVNTFIGTKTLQITKTEYHHLYRPNSIYVPGELRFQEKYQNLIETFLHRKLPKPRSQ